MKPLRGGTGISRTAHAPGPGSRPHHAAMELYPLGLLLGLVATWLVLAVSDRVRAMPR